jgi:hypothetical protein
VPTEVPVQPEFVYQTHVALVPSDPPTTLTVLDAPEQMLVGLAVAPVAAVDETHELLLPYT